MPEILIACGGDSPAVPKNSSVLELDLSPDADKKRKIRFDPGSVSAPLLDNLPDPLADALEIAAYVFSADRLIRRGREATPHIGSEWQRRLRFRIPVRNVELWNRPEVKETLSETLCFLSGDDVEFQFTQAGRPAWADSYLGFNDAVAQTISPDRVVLFSGGLDSLAGVAECVLGSGLSAVLVTHQSASQIANRQNNLYRAIENLTPRGQTFYAPVWVRRGQEAAPLEHTQRLRAFLFATLGITYARMFRCNSVLFYENGITSFNLPMAQQVVGTRASRTTHPRVLAGFGRLFSLLLDEPVSFENPFLWKTKTDVVQIIAKHGVAELIGLTTSCANVRNLSMSGLQCGCCSQCVERQYAMRAAGLAHLEPPGSYQCDLFVGAQQDGRDLSMVEAHVLRAQKLATLSEQAFLSNYGQVFRALADVGGPPDQTARQIFQLHRRYGAEIISVVDMELQKHSTLSAILDLPETSLLALVRSPLGGRSGFVDPSEHEPPASTVAALDMQPVPSRRLHFAVEQNGSSILFDHGVTLRGKGAALLLRLIDQFNSDLAAGIDKNAYGYVPTNALCDHLHCSEPALRQTVARARRTLETSFEAKTGFRLDRDDVIQNVSWTGYRLNPFLLKVEWRQLQQEPMSRLPIQHVTSSAGKAVNAGSACA